MVRAQIYYCVTRRTQRGNGTSGDVIDICEIARLASVTENDNRLFFVYPLNKSKQTHVRSPGRTVDREITQHCHVETIKMVITVAKAYRRFLRCGVRRQRAASAHFFRIGYWIISSVQAGGRCEYEFVD